MVSYEGFAERYEKAMPVLFGSWGTMIVTTVFMKCTQVGSAIHTALALIWLCATIVFFGALGYTILGFFKK